MSFLWLWEHSCEGVTVTSNIMDFCLHHPPPPATLSLTQAAPDWKLGYCALSSHSFTPCHFFSVFIFFCCRNKSIQQQSRCGRKEEEQSNEPAQRKRSRALRSCSLWRYSNFPQSSPTLTLSTGGRGREKWLCMKQTPKKKKFYSVRH